ncbi:50S ribosomal protein L2 [Candidatus Peregrinibacteria bacterium CG11_big_fil_rev_8_21_14_0_20_46_8]|nr:MAG: 50S ribosomal protein L2 [Candidatus Peregrinibacteria bacterium CG11_big_fil_rev_8_21_14_0_20_46_8]
MPVKKYKPTTPGQRQRVSLTYEELTKKRRPAKRMRKYIKEKAGRNNQGKLTVRHRGGGHKTLYRLIDFKQVEKINIPGKISSVEYDPYRSCFIILVVYADGDKRYHIAPHGLKVGDEVICKPKAKAKNGNRLKLKYIPVGFEIHNIETNLGKGGQIVRSAGAVARLISLEGKYAQVQLPSKEVRLVNKDCYATIGRVSNVDHGLVKIGKAGRSRHMGRRPVVRGKVMNPVDHPHGGGEGRNSIGMKYPKTKWGAPALGVKTRKRKKWTNRFIARTRKGKQLIKMD